MIDRNLAIPNGFMKPKTQDASAFELFQARFSQILNAEHPLVQLADKIDWPRFDAEFADSYCPEFGAPGKAIRLMVGLQYLKYAFSESDESLVDRWVENPYWQYFCGFTHMQHEPPLDPSSMTRWRKRVGAERLELLIKETIALALREKQVRKKDLAQVTIDTTVQEKNITHPTDSKLLYTAIRKLVRPPDSTAYGCGSRTCASANAPRSKSAATRTPGNSSVCARNYASCARTSDGWCGTFGAKPARWAMS